MNRAFGDFYNKNKPSRTTYSIFAPEDDNLLLDYQNSDASQGLYN